MILLSLVNGENGVSLARPLLAFGAMTPSAAPLVFVPGLGFISSDAKMLREPVTERVDDWEITVDRVLVDRGGTRVAVTIYGPFKLVGDRFKQPDVKYDDFIQARDRNGIVSARRGDYFPHGHGFSARGTSLSCTANMAALTAREDRIDVLINEPLPLTIIPVNLTPIADAALPARVLDVSDEHHGVVITAHAIASGNDTTAVLLHASLRPHPRQRFMRGLGVIHGGPWATSGISLTDDAGKSIMPFAGTAEPSPGPEFRTIVACPGVSRDARQVTITVPYVVIAEYTGTPVTLAVPYQGDMTLGDDAAHVKVERQTAPRGGAAVSVEFMGAWRDGRRLLYAESLTVGDKYGGVGFRGAPPTEPPILTYAEDPTGSATSVALESPNIQLQGPWRLVAALP